MAEQIDGDRRRLLATVVASAAAAELGMIGSADAQPIKMGPTNPGTNTSFASLKQIDAGLLNVGYAEAGPANGPPVILLHGWPYDIYSFVDVAPLLASAGYRVIVPYVRGYGSTRFLSSDDVPEWPAVGGRGRSHRADGCSQDPEGDARRLRLGSADRQHRRGALARALQGAWCP